MFKKKSEFIWLNQKFNILLQVNIHLHGKKRKYRHPPGTDKTGSS